MRNRNSENPDDPTARSNFRKSTRRLVEFHPADIRPQPVGDVTDVTGLADWVRSGPDPIDVPGAVTEFRRVFFV